MFSAGGVGSPIPIVNQPLDQMGSPASDQYMSLTMTQPIHSATNPNYTTHIRAPLTVSQVVTRVAPPTVEMVQGISSATFVKEIEIEERYEIVPVKSPPTLPQKKEAPQMINYEIPREPVSVPREPQIREKRAPKPKEIAVERERPVERERAVKERTAAPEPEEEPPAPEVVIRQHRIEVPVELLRIVEKIVQVPVERVCSRDLSHEPCWS
jgi:hypothetical protein